MATPSNTAATAPDTEEDDSHLSVGEKRRLFQAAAEVDAITAKFRAELAAQTEAEGIVARPETAVKRTRANSHLPPRHDYLRAGAAPVPALPSGTVAESSLIIDNQVAVSFQVQAFEDSRPDVDAETVPGQPPKRTRANTLPSRNIYGRDVTPNDAEVMEKARMASAVEDISNELEAFKRMMAGAGAASETQ
eukprot:c15290_g1_i1.p1 GENE.c15290_g1_i1~~c15290_g1_i1.p1  ORF type:complete len:192 (+),score=32.99 c15290_g1_i1:124-699(+)